MRRLLDRLDASAGPLFAEDLQREDADALEVLARARLVAADDGAYSPAFDGEASRFLRGGWLEYLAGVALVRAGLTSVAYGQVISWEPGHGAPEIFNEIDALGLIDGQMALVSCKASRPDAVSSPTGVDRLFDALQEVSYWNDHFAGGEGLPILVTTVDLIDEKRGRRRRSPVLERRAEALGVRMVSPDLSSAHSLEDAIKNAFGRNF